MEQGNTCPRCNNQLRFISEYHQWYCDYCRIYPYVQPMPMPMPYVRPPSLSDDSANLIIKIILGIIILLIVAGIIIAAVVLSNLPPFDTEALQPQGTLSFSESETIPGDYEGNFVTLTQIVDLRDIYMRITDESQGSTAILSPLFNGGIAQVPSGMSCTFTDTDGDHELDTVDLFTIHNGAPGDLIEIIYLPTEDLIASHILS